MLSAMVSGVLLLAEMPGAKTDIAKSSEPANQDRGRVGEGYVKRFVTVWVWYCFVTTENKKTLR